MPPKRHSTSSQAGPSRRRRVASSGSSDEDVPATQATQGGRSALGTTKVRDCAAKLVRLALFYEYQHKVIRRDAIVQNVIPAAGKGATGTFDMVFQAAQGMLRTKFGMELHELRGRWKGNGPNEQPQTQAQTQTQRGRRSDGRLDAISEGEEDMDDAEALGATGTQGAKKKRTNTWVLRSILAPEYRDLMTTPQPLPLFDEDGDRQDHGDYVDSGAIIPWDKADGTASGSIQMLGIRTVILCLVMCSGRAISDDHLHALLRRLNLRRDTVLPYSSPDGKAADLTVDKYLDLLAQQQYLEKVKTSGQLHSAEAAQFEWRWGNREAEFSEKAAAQLIVELLTGDDASDDEDDEDDDADDERARRATRRKRKEAKAKRLEALNGDIVKAAGGPLADA